MSMPNSSAARKTSSSRSRSSPHTDTLGLVDEQQATWFTPGLPDRHAHRSGRDYSWFACWCRPDTWFDRVRYVAQHPGRHDRIRVGTAGRKVRYAVLRFGMRRGIGIWSPTTPPCFFCRPLKSYLRNSRIGSGAPAARYSFANTAI